MARYEIKTEPIDQNLFEDIPTYSNAGREPVLGSPFHYLPSFLRRFLPSMGTSPRVSATGISSMSIIRIGASVVFVAAGAMTPGFISTFLICIGIVNAYDMYRKIGGY